jgi:hypothetical protein
MTTSLLLPPKNNFADLRELADNLLKSSSDKSLKRLAGIVGTLLYRCDLLEREVERLGRAAPTIPTSPRKKSPRVKRGGR